MTTKAHSIVGYRPDGRPEADYYPTPPAAVAALLHRQAFGSKEIWEPACGDGAISRVLEHAGYTVYSSDLFDRGYGEAGKNFLETMARPCDTIITNPPFSLAEQFLVHALNIGVVHIALLLKLTFLEGQARSKVLERSPLETVWVFRKRLTMTRGGENMTSGGMIAFAWFVWRAGYSGAPAIGWLP